MLHVLEIIAVTESMYYRNEANELKMLKQKLAQLERTLADVSAQSSSPETSESNTPIAGRGRRRISKTVSSQQRQSKISDETANSNKTASAGNGNGNGEQTRSLNSKPPSVNKHASNIQTHQNGKQSSLQSSLAVRGLSGMHCSFLQLRAPLHPGHDI